MTNSTRGTRGLVALSVALAIVASCFYLSGASAQDGKSQLLQSYQQLFDRSLKEKKGLNFYVKGQTIGAVFVKLIGAEAIEVRNQTYGRIIIRLDSIDAVAIN